MNSTAMAGYCRPRGYHNWLDGAAPKQHEKGQRMIWFLIIATGIFTFGTRFIMLSGIFGKNLPAWLIEALGFVPIAVLTAIIVPAVLIDPANQHIAITNNPRLLAAFVAIAVALITRQVITTIGTGMATLWALQWLF